LRTTVLENSFEHQHKKMILHFLSLFGKKKTNKIFPII